MRGGAELVMISHATADSLDALIGQLRADVKRLQKERDDLQCENARIAKQNLQLCDDLYDLQQRLALRDHREG